MELLSSVVVSDEIHLMGPTVLAVLNERLAVNQLHPNVALTDIDQTTDQNILS